MDYLEGALLGKLWSDTDFENRKHRGAAILLSLLFWVAFAGLVVSSNMGSDVSDILRRPRYWISWTIFLMLLSPILNYNYYKLPTVVRLLILLVQTGKYFSAAMIPLSLYVPRIVFNMETLMGDAVTWLDLNVGGFIERSTESNEVFGLVWSGVVTVLAALLILALVVAVIILLPLLYLQLIRLLQWVIDQVFLSLVRPIRSAWHDYKERHPDMNWQTMWSGLKRKQPAGSEKAPVKQKETSSEPHE